MNGQRTVVDLLLVERCTGCAVCGNVCPVQALTMLSDVSGFDSPQADESILVPGFQSMLSQEPVMQARLRYIILHIRERAALAVDIIRPFLEGEA